MQSYAKLLEVKWIVASQNALPAQDALLGDRVHRLQGLPCHESLLLQGGAVAIDEVRFYLTAMDSVGPVRSCHPLVIHFLTDLHTEAAEWLCDMASFSDQQTGKCCFPHGKARFTAVRNSDPPLQGTGFQACAWLISQCTHTKAMVSQQLKPQVGDSCIGNKLSSNH